MKVPIDFDGMSCPQLLSLARRAVREFNDRALDQYKLVMK